MSEIEEAIVSKLMDEAAITDLIGQRLYPQVVPQDVARPSMAYQLIDQVPAPSRHSAHLARSVVQFTCEAETYEDAKVLAAAIREVLTGWSDDMGELRIDGAFVVNQSDGYSEQHLAPVVRVDVAIWHAV